ncbi:MAG: DUF424 family protein [Candidatus Bathyarchaeia archaeon]
MTDVYLNVIRHGRHVLVAACDAEILGRTLRNGKVEFYVNEKFYKGDKVGLDEAIQLIRDATSANLVGNNLVRRATLEGLVHPQAIAVISGVPHAQIVKL